MKNIFILLIIPYILIASSFNLEEASLNYGKNIYEATCKSCHGEDGKAQTNMKLVIKPRDLTKSILNQEQVYKIIKDGSFAWGAKSDIMPSFKSVYDVEQLNSVAYYVFKSFIEEQNENYKNLLSKSTNSSLVSVELGKEIYIKECKECHDKKGTLNVTTKDKRIIYPYNLKNIILNENQIFMYTKYGGKYWGTDKSDMNSWHKKYSDIELKSLAKYISEFIKKK